MSLSKRKSRIIVVGENQYRWSPAQDSGFIVLVVQDSSGNGKRLEVIISDDQHIIIENGSYSIEIGSTRSLIVQPKLVAQIITDALALGWNPKENGKPVELSFNDGALEIRRGL